MKKGQITMEALLLYGAAILVVLLAVAALIYFGVLDLGVFLPEKCSISGGVMSCEEYQVSSSGVISLVIQNRGTKSFDITSATFEAKDVGLANGCTASSLGGSIIPGATQQIDINCATFNAISGKKLSGKLLLTYQYSGGTLNNPAAGDLTATVS